MTRAKSSFRRPLPVRDLRWRCPPSRFRVATTADAKPLMETIGQEGAMEALRLGVELYGPGYNVFVEGLPGLGKSTLVRRMLEDLTPYCALPADRVYVNCFRHPERPRLLELPRGGGGDFARAMSRALELIAEGIRRLADDKAFSEQREKIVAEHRERERKTIDAFEKAAADAGFTAGARHAGGEAEPEIFLAVEGGPVSMGDLDAAIRAGKVEASREAEIRATYASLRSRLAETLRRTRVHVRERSRALEAQEREVAERLVASVAAEIRERFPYPAVAEHLRDAQAHFIEHFPRYAHALLEAVEDGPVRPDAVKAAAEEVFREFRPNVLLDATTVVGCPVEIEQNPTWTNLLGQIEREVDAKGNVRTDFLMIRAGSLLRADGGYLVLQLRDVLEQQGVWDELKRVLKHRRLEIQMPEPLASASPMVLRPDPIPVNVKVVLIGDEGTWQGLREADPDFAETFKVRAAFERDTPLTDEALRRYASFFRNLAKEEGLAHLHRTGLAAVAEEGVREAGRKGRLSVRFGRLADVVREAHYAARRAGADVILGEHVREALRAAARRMGVEERRVREAVRQGLLLVDVAGSRVGTINGLALYDFGDHRFGKVARITATVGAGQAGVVDVERLADLSGSTHSKGVLVLAGYLRGTFAAERPPAFTASVVFEQSYGGVEGDSATCAEAFAVLSALSGIPVRQDLAVTGSMNQHGDVQSVGGVNDKIEGFFDLCSERGLSGTQGAVIPRANVGDLMLREDIVEACAKRRFSVFAIDRIEEGMELLTGRPAGVAGPGRAFRKGSVYAAVEERLGRLAKAALHSGNRPSAV
jgi:lon-related putative ATP-dependent protease